MSVELVLIRIECRSFHIDTSVYTGPIGLLRDNAVDSQARESNIAPFRCVSPIVLPFSGLRNVKLVQMGDEVPLAATYPGLHAHVPNTDEKEDDDSDGYRTLSVIPDMVDTNALTLDKTPGK